MNYRNYETIRDFVWSNMGALYNYTQLNKGKRNGTRAAAFRSRLKKRRKRG